MMKKIFIILAAALGCFATTPVTSPTSASSELSRLEVVERLHEKILSYPALKNWQASTLTNLYEMDKNWEPKKKTVVEKLVTVKDNARVEKVLRATEYDGDKTKDVTAKFRAEAEKLNKKSESREGKDGGRKGGRYRGLDLNRGELFPFEENKRKDYDFEVSEGFLEADRKVIILETRSRQKSSEYYEGKFYIHPETYDILRVELQPAKNPGPLKLLEMHIDFRHLPGGYLVIDTARVRIHVGLIIKNIRMESEEIYSDYEIFTNSNSVTGYLSPDFDRFFLEIFNAKIRLMKMAFRSSTDRHYSAEH